MDIGKKCIKSTNSFKKVVRDNYTCIHYNRIGKPIRDSNKFMFQGIFFYRKRQYVTKLVSFYKKFDIIVMRFLITFENNCGDIIHHFLNHR